MKKRLLKMQIRYIVQCSEEQNWMYWKDYMEEGILAFSPPPDTMMEKYTSDASHKTPDITARKNVVRSDMLSDNTHTASVKTVSASLSWTASRDQVISCGYGQ